MYVSLVKSTEQVQADAVPFFEFMISEISRSRARFGSKFWGSTAFSTRESQFPSNQWQTNILDRHTNVSLQGSLRWFAKTPKAVSCSVPRRCSFHAFYQFSKIQSLTCKRGQELQKLRRSPAENAAGCKQYDMITRNFSSISCKLMIGMNTAPIRL